MKRLQIIGLIVLAISGILGAWFLWHTPPEPQPPQLPQPALKDLGDKANLQLGNFAILNHIHEKAYSNILTSQFDFVLADNTPNWYFTDGGLRPTVNTYNFKQLDEVMAYAETNHMPVQAHHLLWGDEKWLPDWLKNGNFSQAQLMQQIEQHIKTVAGHYKGRVREWTVVNEPFSRGLNLYDLHDWWADNTGSQEYIDHAFIWAREADPNAKLIINDFQNEAQNNVSDAMYAYVKGAKARGIPIDGVGLQMHIDGTHPPMKDEVISNMKRFGELGVEVYVTEFDVNMNDVKAEGDDKDKIQADIYFDMVRACIDSKVCHSFAFLGISDEETWYNYIGLPDPRPLMFDRDYQPKGAYYSVRDALQQD